MGELTEFCCNHGKHILPQLPPYLTEIDNIINNCNASTLSRKLNILFSYTAIGVQGQFVNLSAPSSICVTGPNNYNIQNEWVSIVQQMLTKINPYTHSLQMLQDNSSHNALLELHENTSNGEVAAIIHADNITNVQPHSILFWCNTDIAPKFVNILSAQYEPLQYPLLFPHGTPRWHSNNYYNFSQIDWYRSKKWCSTRVANALALARCRGNSSFFVTMTTNPNWKVIRLQLCPGQNAAELAPIVVQAFHSHLGKLKDMLCIHPELPINQIDKVVFAELPCKNAYLKKLVMKYMLHKPQHSSRCLRNGKCIYQYSKPIIPETYIDERGFVQYRRRTPDNIWIGPDYTKFTINNNTNDNINQSDLQTTGTANNTLLAADGNYPPAQKKAINEFRDYIKRRYLSAPEAA
ncbi:13019_t:CDS:2 [Cetraspora pellucida]|uniref:13019_t:CDS:1 n=1 Tax=Cetraspora pellucida TaxID=1433469 RepID=A0ACA9M9M3_9GLOM|nr:13019_t:CDS:2 [Cetraspora pellucida]